MVIEIVIVIVIVVATVIVIVMATVIVMVIVTIIAIVRAPLGNTSREASHKAQLASRPLGPKIGKQAKVNLGGRQQGFPLEPPDPLKVNFGGRQQGFPSALAITVSFPKSIIN